MEMVKKFVSKENVFELDGSSMCPFEISIQHPNIHQHLLEITKSHDESQFPVPMEDWYKKVQNSKTVYRPPETCKAQDENETKVQNKTTAYRSTEKSKALDKNETKLFLTQAPLFDDNVLLPASRLLCKKLLSVLKDCSVEISQSTNYAFLAYTPVQSGSMREGTKTFVPEETDITCKLNDVTGLEILDKKKSQSVIRVRGNIAHSGWAKLCKENDILCPKLLSSTFTDVLKETITNVTSTFLKPMSFSVHSVQKKDKIPCFYFLFRDETIKDLVISVDFVVAIPHPEYKLDRPLPLPDHFKQDKCKFYLIPKVSQRKSISSSNSFFLVSYSAVESSFVEDLPDKIRTGFIYAKAARNAKLCSLPDELSRRVREPIDVQEFVTTYMLKTCLMIAMSNVHLAYKLKNSTSYEFAYILYVMLHSYVKYKGKLPFYFDKSINLVHCQHDYGEDYDDKLGCCLKRALIVGFCECIMESLGKLVEGAVELRIKVEDACTDVTSDDDTDDSW